VCGGKLADLAASRLPKPTPASPGSRSRHIITQRFLETILLKEPFRSAIPRQGVRISGATSTEPVDLAGAKLPWDLWLDASTFEHGADFSELDASGDLTFDGTRVSNTLDLSFSHIGHSLGLRSGHYDHVNLDRAKIDGDVDVGAYSDEKGKPKATRIDGELSLFGTRIDGSFIADGAILHGNLDMDSTKIGLHLSLQKASLTDVNLAGAIIEGQAHLEDSRIRGVLNLENIQAKRHLLLGGAIMGSLRAPSAQIGASFELVGATISGKTDLASIEIGGHLIASGAHLQNVELEGAHIAGRVDFPPFNLTRIVSRNLRLWMGT
jgi:hypothetical protein